MGQTMVVSRIMSRFAAAYPQVVLETFVDDETGDLRERGEDAGIRGPTLIPQDMIQVRLSPVGRQVAVASPDYLRRHGAPQTLADLGEPQMRAVSPAVRRGLPLGVPGRRAPPRGSGPGLDGHRQHGSGPERRVGRRRVAYTNEAHARPHLEAGRLKVVLEPYALPFEGWRLYYPSRRNMTGPLRAFVEFMRRPDVLALIAERAARPVAA